LYYSIGLQKYKYFFRVFINIFSLSSI